MSAKPIGLLAVTLLLTAPGTATAQTVITFDVPLNLTQVPPEIEKVGVACLVMGDGLTNSAMTSLGGGLGGPLGPLAIFAPQIPSSGPVWVKVEWPVMAGQAVAPLKLSLAIIAEYLDNPLGKTAQYGCILGGYSKSLQKWDMFDANHTIPAFRLAPTPQMVQGTFVW